MNTEIYQLLQEGVTLITPTNRLSRHLQSQYAAFQIARGKAVWQTPDILPWTAWLQRSWEDISIRKGIRRLLLNSYQQQALWQEMITSSPYAQQLLQNTTTAKQAVDAWNLLQHWELSTFPDEIYLNEDARVFSSWASAYQKKCETENWFDEARLTSIYGELVQQYNYSLGQTIALIGFVEFTPQQKTLLACLQQLGCKVSEVRQENRKGLVRQAVFIDTRQEIRAAANWARQLLNKGDHGSIGVVLPNLQSVRSVVEAEFDDVLFPAAILSAADIEQRPYSISIGRALNEYPLVDTALTLLGLLRQPGKIDDLSLLLRSPFLKEAQLEQQKRARLDAVLRDYGEMRLSINTILYVTTNKLDASLRCQVFIECLLALKDLIQTLPGKQSPAQWAETFSQALTIMGWPGERTLNSAEYQTVEAWQQVIERFVSLDLVSSSLNQTAALSKLRRLVTEFSFQPETVEAPIQILGMTGAAEMQFEHLWLVGLHEETWPQAAQPNPFIPIKLQRELRMPRATAEFELEYARNMTQQLMNSSPDIVLSYPQNEKERVLRPSPMLKAYLDEASELSVEQSTLYAQQILQNQKLEILEDNLAPAIVLGDKVRGGAALFKDQSACAFRAFARHRLHARSLADVDIGLDAMDRGSLIHALMQVFWNRVKSQHSLLEMDESNLKSLILNCASKVVGANQEKRPHTFTERFTKLEVSRLRGLLNEWLEQERLRATFTTQACEQEYGFNVEDIEVRIRVDRIDELEDGRQVVVDYKTGQASVHDWFDERPDDPQLPLYAIASPVDIAALTFARIKRGEMAYFGLAEDSDVLPRTAAYADSRYATEFETWQELLTSWRTVLSKLAIAFREGDALVNPKDTNTCRYCDLHSFCRIYEKTAKATDGCVDAGGSATQGAKAGVTV